MNISVSILTGKGVPDKRMEENKKTFILPSIDMLHTSEEDVSVMKGMVAILDLQKCLELIS